MRPLWKQCLGLAWPLIASHQITMWNEALLMFWLGRIIGSDGVATYTLVLPAYDVVSNAFFALAIGSSTLVTWSIGAKDRRGLSIIASTLTLLVLAWVVAAVAALVAAGPIAGALAPSPALAGDIRSLLVAMFLVMLPTVGFAEILLECANAAGWTKLALGRAVLDLVFLASVTPLLVGPVGLGIVGAPIAAGIAAAGLSLVTWRALRRRFADELGASAAVAASTWRRVLDIGIPVQVVRIGYFGAQALLIRRIGVDGASAVAGYGLSYVIVGLGFGTTLAVAQAGAILAGQSIGRRDLATARAALRTSALLACACASLFFVAMSVLPGPMLHIFTGDQAAIDAGIDIASVLRFVLFPAAAFQVLMTGFSAFGATKRAGLLGLVAEAIAVTFAYTWHGAGTAGQVVAAAVVLSFTLKSALYLVLGRYVFVRLPTT